MADFVDAILVDNFFEGSNDVRSGWKFFFITKQILLHNFALPDFISNDFIFQAYFLKHFGWFWPILLMRFYLIEWSKINFQNIFTFFSFETSFQYDFFFPKKIKNHHFRAFFSLTLFWIFWNFFSIFSIFWTRFMSNFISG